MDQRPAFFAQDGLVVGRHFLEQALQLCGEGTCLDKAFLFVVPVKNLVVQGPNLIPLAPFFLLFQRGLLLHVRSPGSRLEKPVAVASIWRPLFAKSRFFGVALLPSRLSSQ